MLHALSQKEPSQAQRLEALLADDLRKLLSLPAAAKRAKMDDGPQAASAAPADATQSSSPARVPLVSIANMVGHARAGGLCVAPPARSYPSRRVARRYPARRAPSVARWM